jgi:hypothetical protein
MNDGISVAVVVGSAVTVGSNVGDNVGISVGRNDAEGAGDAEGTDEGAVDADGATDGASVLKKNNKHDPSISVQTFSSPAHCPSTTHTCVGLSLHTNPQSASV